MVFSPSIRSVSVEPSAQVLNHDLVAPFAIRLNARRRPLARWNFDFAAAQLLSTINCLLY